MALFPSNEKKLDGIQLGGPNTLCYKCELERRATDTDSDIPYGEMQYKEVFKIDNFGEPICLCMKHFKQKLGKYILVDSTELSNIDEEVQEKPKKEEQVKKSPAKKTTKKEADEDVSMMKEKRKAT